MLYKLEIEVTRCSLKPLSLANPWHFLIIPISIPVSFQFFCFVLPKFVFTPSYWGAAIYIASCKELH